LINDSEERDPELSEDSGDVLQFGMLAEKNKKKNAKWWKKNLIMA